MFSRTGLRAAARLAQRPAQRACFSRTAARRAQPPQGNGQTVEKLEGVYDNAFNRERLAVKEHAAATADFWKKLSIYVVIPALIVVSANTWVQWNEHWEHQSHMPPINERPQYSYMNIRSKAYPWGNGDKTLFWNDKYNYLEKGE